MSDIFVTGTRQLKHNIKSMTAEMQQKTLAIATRKGAKVIEEEAKTLAPVDDGGLKAGIITRKNTKDSGDWFVTFDVKVIKAYYWWFLEDGTKKMRAQPFLRPAFATKAKEAALTIIDEFNKTLKKWNRKS